MVLTSYVSQNCLAYNSLKQLECVLKSLFQPVIHSHSKELSECICFNKWIYDACLIHLHQEAEIASTAYVLLSNTFALRAGLVIISITCYHGGSSQISAALPMMPYTRTSLHTSILSFPLAPSPCGYSDPSHTHNVSDIWRGSVLQQKEDNVQVAHEGSHMYWCEARLRNKATAVLLLCTSGGFGDFFR